MNTLLEIIVSNSLLVIVLAFAVALVGRLWNNPPMLHMLWLLVLLKFITPPLLTVPVVLKTTQSSMLSNDSTGPSPGKVDLTAEPPRPLRPRFNDPAFAGSGSNSIIAPPAVEPKAVPWLTIVVGLWLTGIVATALWQAFRIFRFRRLLRARQPPTVDVLRVANDVGKQLGLRRVPPVHMLPQRISPLVWSLGLRPQVLLPMELFARLDVAAQTSILAHELAHVRRKDHLVRLLELLITTLFWWHPVAWWASRELQQAEELCCDALVVGLKHSSARDYATTLLDTLDFLCDGSTAAPLGAAAARSSVLLARRIAMLKTGASFTTLTFARAALLMLAAAVPMSIAVAGKPAAGTSDAGKQTPAALPGTVVAQAAPASADSAPPATAGVDASPAPKQTADSIGGGVLLLGENAETRPATGQSVTELWQAEEHSIPIKPSENWISLPSDFPLKAGDFRAQINMSKEQERKLREISASYQVEWQKRRKEAIAANRLPPAQREAKQKEIEAKNAQQIAMIRPQIEGLLTAEQLAAVKHAAVVERAHLMLFASFNKQYGDLRKSIGLSPQQEKQVDQIAIESEKKRAAEDMARFKTVRDAFTREQREKLIAKFTDADLLGPFIYIPDPTPRTTTFAFNGIDPEGTEKRLKALHFSAYSATGTVIRVFDTLDEPEQFRKELGITAPQDEKLRSISIKFKSDAREAFKSYESGAKPPQALSTEKKNAKRAELQRKLEQIGNDAIRQISAVLTAAQLVAIRKDVQEGVADTMLQYPSPKIFGYVDASEEQRKTVRQLQEMAANGYSSNRIQNEAVEKALLVLTPEQRKKLEEDVERQGW